MRSGLLISAFLAILCVVLAFECNNGGIRYNGVKVNGGSTKPKQCSEGWCLKQEFYEVSYTGRQYHTLYSCAEYGICSHEKREQKKLTIGGSDEWREDRYCCNETLCNSSPAVFSPLGLVVVAPFAFLLN
ncbi:hypothetical protein L596_024992 [Steinernema carpocapsae]|uniref:UPAR/Ly6 domain-containing protein n=1 Tax=Steinernema carpocapsae TaxID=34508 RepID=A0A4U5M6H0_STECR|nr:hypothetical protein L596_024992 [Steinernema carpocapsae]